MTFSRPFITAASAVIVVGLCIGVVLAFLLTCEGENCLLKQWRAKPVVTSFEECAAQGYPIMESYPRQCRVPGGENFTEQTSSTSSEEQSEVNIIVTAPQENTVTGKRFAVTGVARVFENSVSYRLTDENGVVLVESFTTANSPDIGQFGPFMFMIEASAATGSKGVLEVFQNSAKDGSEIDKVTTHVRFQ